MNTKMKVLALALLGLAGYAGSAVAGCPSSPVPPWTAAPVFQGTVAIVAGGLDGSACRLDSSIAAAASGAAFATVEDDTPAGEVRYRAQFMVNLDNLTSQSLLAGVQLFSATNTANGTSIWLTVFGDGSGNRFLGYFVKDTSQASGVYSNSTPLAAGANRVEFDLQTGAAGAGGITFWINNTTEGSPTVPTHNVTNDAYTIDTAFVGLAAPTPQYVTAFSGTTVGFDRFDSRRQTFIGG
jgi:hypothetical protein